MRTYSWKRALITAVLFSPDDKLTGPKFFMSKDMFEQMLKEFDLKLDKNAIPRNSVIFRFEGKEVSAGIDFPSKYYVHCGRWKPDPRWTGD